MAIDWGNIASGALAGAGSGATLGSLIPIPGVSTAVGAGLGALFGGGLGAAGSYFGNPSKPGGPQRASAPNKQENNVLQYLLSQGLGQLQNPLQGFQPIADRARSQFNQITIPSLAERFTSLGNNALSSPSFASSLGQAGAGLEEALAALGADYGQRNQQNAMSMLTLGLSPAFQTYYQPQEHGFGRQLLSGAVSTGLQAAPQLYQSYMLNQALSKLAAGGK
jgi:hypothetical protein